MAFKMSLSRTEFNNQLIDFVCKCKEFQDDWRIFVVEEGQQPRELSDPAIYSNNFQTLQLMLSKNEPSYSKIKHELVNYEYSVIFSDSYEAPVMYFNISNQSGSQLDLETSMLNLQENVSNLQNVVNQVEHPLLFRPFYMVHPCRTQDFMRSHDRKSYLIAWLSTVGTVVNLKLNENFGKLDQGGPSLQ